MTGRQPKPVLPLLAPLTALALTALALGACVDDLVLARALGAYCDVDNPCIEGLYCNPLLDACQAQLEDGGGCDDDSWCESGFCVDGVCCESQCVTPCRACNVGGVLGRCAALTPGSDPLDECPGTTACGASAVCQGSAIWSLGVTGVGSERMSALAVPGDIVIGGSFDGSANFGAGPIESEPGSSDAFVARVLPVGELVWAQTWSGPGNAAVEAVALLDSGDVLVAGWFDGELTIDDATHVATGSSAAFVARLGPRGEGNGEPRPGEPPPVAWHHVLDGPGEDRLFALAVDGDGRIAVAGTSNGLDDCPTESDGVASMLVAVLSDEGVCERAAVLGSELGRQEARAVLWWQESLVIAGAGTGNPSFGDDSYIGSLDGHDDAYVVALDGALVPTWSRAVRGVGADALVAMTAVGERLWLVGSTAGEATLDGQTKISQGGEDALLVVLGPAGEVVDFATFGDRYDDRATSIAASDDGTVVIGGTFQAALDFGDGAIESRGGHDGFVVRLGPDAAPIWSLPVGGGADDQLHAVAVGPDANIVVAMSYAETLVLGETSLEAEDADDGVLAKLAP